MADESSKTAEEIAAEAAEKAVRDRAIAAIPAVFIDTWHTLTFMGHVRVTFGEIYGGASNYRNAIVLDLDDAESLGRHLIRVAERRRMRDKELAARAQEDHSSES